MAFYYLLEDAGSSKNDLPPGKRIFKINSIKNFKDGDGPYRTLKELRKNSLRFKKLLKANPQRAQKIYDKRFLIEMRDQILVPTNIDEELNGKLYQMLDHLISGRFTRNNISGIHFFDPDFHRVVELTKEPNAKGIWEAKIEGLRTQKGDWIEKHRESTFFPIDWSKEILVLKIYEAFKNKKLLKEPEYIGETNCGIKIIFRIKNDKIVSVYPLYE